MICKNIYINNINMLNSTNAMQCFFVLPTEVNPSFKKPSNAGHSSLLLVTWWRNLPDPTNSRSEHNQK